VKTTVRVERTGDSSHWAQITLEPKTPAEDERTIGFSNGFCCSITPLDEGAEGYHLEIWESGILSGLTFVFRRSKLTGVIVHRLEGHLSSGDMDGVAYASTVAGIRAAASDVPIPTNQNWVVKGV
jgi:hypothetical protein